MTDQETIREMAALAMCDEHGLKEGKKRLRFFRSDYIALKVLETVVADTAAFVLLAGLYAAAHMEELLETAVNMNFRVLLASSVALYLAFLSVSIIITLLLAVRSYRRAEREKKKYLAHMARLRERN